MDVTAVREVARALRAHEPAPDDRERVDLIRALEELKSAAAAEQARATADFVASQRREQRDLGLSAERVGRGIAAQVALARRISPYQARRYVGWAMILTTELPATLDALASGRTSEWRAMLVARETAWLSRNGRSRVDQELASYIEDLGDHKVEAEAARLAYGLDPAGAAAKAAAAESDRRVTLRPAPDTMSRLSALLPVAAGVAAYATLGRDADALIGTGRAGGRTRGQVMADLLVARITGQEVAPDVPVEIHLLMTDTALLNRTNDPVLLIGHGPIPAEQARVLIYGSTASTPRWIRRLYRKPGAGELAAMDSHRRLFTDAQRRFIELRDQGTCRTPWCDAPIRQVDHVVSHNEGGHTQVDNGQGLCQACNLAKLGPGWSVTLHGRTVIVRTPTGHYYEHSPPEAPAA